MRNINKTARLAGSLYLLLVVIAPFSLIYVPNTLVVRANAAQTAANLLDHELLFRLGIVGGLVSGVIFLCLVMALYRLLSAVHQNYARLMVGLVLVSVAIGALNEVNNIAALTLARGADDLSVFDKPQRDGLASFFLRLHSQGNFVNELFWGLWLLPFGRLVMKSGFLPRILGGLLIVNGVAYVIASLTWLLLPAYGDVVFRVTMPALFGELLIMLWLLIKGVQVPK